MVISTKIFAKADHDQTFLNLRETLVALGVLADVPSGPAAPDGLHADEIALGFDHWCLSVLSEYEGEVTVRQRALLNALDAYFDAMSRQGDEALWTDEAIRHGPEWGDIRLLAGLALGSFGWQAAHRPPGGEPDDRP